MANIQAARDGYWEGNKIGSPGTGSNIHIGQLGATEGSNDDIFSRGQD